MPARKEYKAQQKEKGLVLLVLAIIIVLAVVTYSFSGISITQVQIDRSKKTMIALKEAKQAVINYAVTYSDIPGKDTYGLFPNPEESLNSYYGNMTPTIGLKNRNVIGWLPWRSLMLPALKDESGTCLFYAVSGTYKLGGSISDMVNEDSIGMFQVVDSATLPNVLQDGVVALVISPGEALADQVRNPLFVNSNCGDDYGNVSAYLEGDGNTDNSTVSGMADTVDTFIHATETSKNTARPYNDKFLIITRDEVWRAIVTRTDFKQDMDTLTEALAMCLANYANMATNTSRRLPWPVNTDFAVLPTDYRDNDKYKDQTLATVTSNGYSGRYPFDVTNSNAAMSPAILGSNLFDVANCSNFGPDADNVIINLTSASPITKYRQLWNNWKDHFFYTLSKRYQPGGPNEQACQPSGGSPGECVKVALSSTPTITTEYAASVIFSGSRLAGVTRNDKSVITGYLEDGKSAVFDAEKAAPSGDRNYLYTDPDADPELANDIMYCLEDATPGTDLGVVSCL